MARVLNDSFIVSAFAISAEWCHNGGMGQLVCKFSPCDRAVVAKGYCKSHYNQHWRGVTLTSIKEKRKLCLNCGATDWEPNRSAKWCSSACQWQIIKPAPKVREVKEKLCTECGAIDWPDNSRLSQCSGRCQALASKRRKGDSVKEIICQSCGDDVDISVKPGERKKRSDTKYCDVCNRLHNLKMVQTGKVTKSQVRSLGTVCAICNLKVDLTLRKPNPLSPSLDHIIPKTLGGSDHISNLQMTHWECNQKKHLRSGNEEFGREERQKFYNLRRWRRLAKKVLKYNPQCSICLGEAVCVDHIQPLFFKDGVSVGGDLWNLSNLQSLCKRCHSLKSQDDYRLRWHLIHSVGLIKEV